MDVNVSKTLGILAQMEQAMGQVRSFLSQQGVEIPPAPEKRGSTNPLVNPPKFPSRLGGMASESAPATQPTRWDRPTPMPPPPPEPVVSPVVSPADGFPIDDWMKLMFRPGMAAAMLFVLLPVIQACTSATSVGEASAAIDQLSTWEQLTVAQRVALTDLFAWVETELAAAPGESAIPFVILSNMAAADGAYAAALEDDGLPTVP